MEATSDIRVLDCVDVIVAGGGLGGIAAALAAARTGAKTLLIERNTYVGGVATAGMCCSMFNCFFTSKHQPGSLGIPWQVAERLADAMGYGRKWQDHKGHVIYDLELGKLVFQEMLAAAGVSVLTGVDVVDVIRDGRAVSGVVIGSKAGRQDIRAKTVVDATGDADVAFFAGVRLHQPSLGAGSGKHSLCFRLGNIDVDAFVDYFRAHPDEYPAMMDVEWVLADALRQYDECGTFLFPHGGGMQMAALMRAKADGVMPSTVGIHDTTDACQMHAMRQTGMVHVITGFVTFDGLDAELISRAVDDGRRMAFILADVYRRYLPGFEKSFVAGVADNLGVRSSRWLDGDFVLTAAMTAPGTRCDDAVARLVPYKNEVRHTGKRAWGVQVMGDDTFDLPYRCLLPPEFDGLIMGSGRSISAANPWLLRVMVHTMSVGQAAGVAAALAARTGTRLRDLSPCGMHEALGNLGETFHV